MSGDSSTTKKPSYRMLVVDDNVDSARSLAFLLDRLGHTTSMAHDGPAALAAAQAHLPQVVLLDLGMPEMDGYEVCRRLRVEDWGKDITVIALSGWGDESDKSATKQAGFDHHLVKPLDVKVLLQYLQDRI